MKLKERESDIVQAILQYLRLIEIVCWRNQSGVIFQEYKGKTRAIRMSEAGISDIIAIYPDGRLWAIEVKAGRNMPTLAQQEFLERVKKAGGLSLVAYSVDEVKEFLEIKR